MDLDGVRSRILRRRQDIQPELTAITFQIESLVNESSVILRSIETHNDSVAQAEARVREIEQTLFVEGKSVHDLRIDLKAEKLQLEEQLRQYRREQTEIVSHLLPFAITRNLSERLEEQLESERRQRQLQASKKIVRDLLPRVCAELKSDLKLSSAQDSALLRASENSWVEAIDRESSAVGIALHGLSDSQGLQMVRHIRESQVSVQRRLADIETKTQRAYDRMKLLTTRLNRLALHAVVPETQTEYRALNDRLVRERAQLQAHSARHEELTRTLNGLKLQKVKLEQDLVGFDIDSRKIETSARVSRVIEGLFQKLSARKLNELAEKTTEIYKSLARKPGLISDIRFAEADLKISLISKDGTAIKRSSLSAGEKQMLAVSILWALGKVSGRNLPIVIDTPLARLDSDHRDSFVLKYLPRASHQVVVLSTDTEVDKIYYQRLDNHIADKYLLHFESASGSSEVRKGYFFGAVR